MKTETYTAHIYIGGDLDAARQVCRQYAYEIGECVTVEPVEFIYKGGAETGVRVGFINYPRFPSSPAVIFAKATDLAKQLLIALCQQSPAVRIRSPTGE